MSGLELNLALSGGLWVAAAWVGALRTRALEASGAVALILLAVGVWRGIVLPAELVNLPAYTGLSDAAMPLVAGGVFGAAAARTGWREASRWAPVAFGLLCGELGGAILAVQGVKDGGVAARRVMAASAGALLSRVADPAIWLLVDGLPGLRTDGWGTTGLPTWGLLAACAAIGVVLAFPPRVANLQTHRPPMLLGVGAMVWLGSWLPLSQLVVVWLGAAVLWFEVRARADLPVLIRPALLVLGGLVAVSAGLAEGAATLLEARLIDDEAQLPLVVWGCGAVGGLLLGSDGGGLAGRAVLDRALAVRLPTAPELWALGAAVSGLGPHLLTGTTLRALPRHFAWIAGSGALVWGAHHFGWLGG